jgi:DNA-binding LytR/AlgR family response regulator
MGKSIKILIVEDEMLIAANISLQLSKIGYEVSGILTKGEDALIHIKESEPDIILLDINLKGNIDGIEMARIMQETNNIPIIYLTANADDENFQRAMATHPFAFIPKPFRNLDLQRAIELTISRLQNESISDKNSNKTNPKMVLQDSIFVRNHEKLVKVNIKDIFYIEAERNYCRIYSKGKEYLLVMTLKELDERLPPENFIRIHRSYIINLMHIDEVALSHVNIAKKAIPISKTTKEELLNRLHTI